MGPSGDLPASLLCAATRNSEATRVGAHAVRRAVFSPCTALLFIAAAGVLCACSGPEGGALQANAPLGDPAACAAASGDDPWLPTDSRYARTAWQGDRDVWFGSISGAAWVRNRLYVFDGAATRVLVFDDRLTSVVDSFGNQGQGPGEFQSGGFASVPSEYGPRRWLMPAEHDELIIFDGDRVQRFGADGRYLGPATSATLGEPGLTPSSPRFGWAHDSLYFFAGGYDSWYQAISGDTSPAFYARVEARGRRSELMAMPLPPLPTGPTEAVGPRQARPLWAVGPKCLWATDGSRPVFHRVRRDGTARDSIALHLDLPDPIARADTTVARLLRETGSPSRSFPEPSALWRMRDLLFDPAGRLWIRLNPRHASDSDVAVAVLDPASGETVGFAVPAFPLAFGAPGVFYAATRDSLSRPLIGLYAIALTDVAPPTSSHR